MNIEEKLKNIIENFLIKTSIQAEDLSVSLDSASNIYWARMRTIEPDLLIGHNGENLNALNYLIKRMMEKELTVPGGEFQNIPTIIIDVNNFQKKRIEDLETVAHTMAERAKFFKSDIEADPMSPQDRRIIHSFLSERPNIKTESIGIGRDRRVVIKYID
jgi:spoIIIJ-associated protein